jgi:uncharacterized membrane protein
VIVGTAPKAAAAPGTRGIRSWFTGGNLLDRTFAVGIILKGLDGVLEVAGALILLLVSPATIDQLTRALTQHELSEDPHDFLATHLLHFTGSLSGSAVQFGAAYLLSHGIVKIVLVIALLKDKLWAYPWMIAFLIVFIVYQVYRMTFAFSIGLLGLTIFDAFVVWLTWREYGKQRELRPSVNDRMDRGEEHGAKEGK